MATAVIALCGIVAMHPVSRAAHGTSARAIPAAATAASSSSAAASAARSRSILAQITSSPFAEESMAAPRADGPLPLTLENVELVLDDMRPYLIADGGNVAVRDIDGATVILELEGACGTCPSSSMTMKMGLEKGLLDRIPEIVSVEQISAEGVPITEENIEAVLDEIRPILKMVKGDVQLLSVDPGDLQPSCTLRVIGQNAAIKSIRGEIIQRLRKEMPTLQGVLWEYENETNE